MKKTINNFTEKNVMQILQCFVSPLFTQESSNNKEGPSKSTSKTRYKSMSQKKKTEFKVKL